MSLQSIWQESGPSMLDVKFVCHEIGLQKNRLHILLESYYIDIMIDTVIDIMPHDVVSWTI